MRENVVAPLDAFVKTIALQKAANLAEPNIGVRGAPQDLEKD